MGVRLSNAVPGLVTYQAITTIRVEFGAVLVKLKAMRSITVELMRELNIAPAIALDVGLSPTI